MDQSIPQSGDAVVDEKADNELVVIQGLFMDNSELQSRIHQLHEEKPVVRLNRLFATHLQNEVDSWLVNSMQDIMASFEDEWSLDLTDEDKTNLIMGMDVRVEVNSVLSGSPFGWPHAYHTPCILRPSFISYKQNRKEIKCSYF